MEGTNLLSIEAGSTLGFPSPSFFRVGTRHELFDLENNWENLLASLEKGGLGIGSLKAFNLALLQKWRWRLVAYPNSLWAQVIKAIHGEEAGFKQNRCKSNDVWSKIVGSINQLHSSGIVPKHTLHSKLGCGTKLEQVAGFEGQDELWWSLGVGCDDWTTWIDNPRLSKDKKTRVQETAPKHQVLRRWVMVLLTKEYYFGGHVINAYRTSLCKSKRGGLKDTYPNDILALVLKILIQLKLVISSSDLSWDSAPNEQANAEWLLLMLAFLPDFYDIGIGDGLEYMIANPMAWDRFFNPKVKTMEAYLQACFNPKWKVREKVPTQRRLRTAHNDFNIISVRRHVWQSPENKDYNKEDYKDYDEAQDYDRIICNFS
ncbi:hypothetical protein Tco_0866426 [Tanacetum coccineum]